jgi:geranylgeranyl pyrophosphate synthase
MSNIFEAIPPQILQKIGELELHIESDNCHQAIDELLSRTVLSGGKRLRPMLCFLIGHIYNLDLDKLDPFAKAIEMVHAASLAHDDVVDNATQRRGEDSINIVASNKKAVLSGDYLLADVIYSLAEQNDLKIVQEMSTVIKDLALGEWIQSDAIEQRSYTQEMIEKIAHYKTASVMSWCTWLPSHVCGCPQEVQESSRELGRRVGLAFQLMDDTLDFKSTSEKDYLLDVKNGVVNSVILEWLELNPQKFEDYKNGESLESLWDEKNLEQAVNTIKTKAAEHMNVARQCLDHITQYLEQQGHDSLTERKAPLEFIMSFIINRNH